MEDQIERGDFIRFVNRIYYLNSHLIERLDELKSFPSFTHLQKNIALTISSMESQISRIDRLFGTLGAVNSYSDCAQMIAFLENLFTPIQSTENKARYLSLIDYISVADCLIEESAKLAIISSSSIPKLSLAEYKLHDPTIIQSLKSSLQIELCN